MTCGVATRQAAGRLRFSSFLFRSRGGEAGRSPVPGSGRRVNG